MKTIKKIKGVINNSFQSLNQFKGEEINREKNPEMSYLIDHLEDFVQTGSSLVRWNYDPQDIDFLICAEELPEDVLEYVRDNNDAEDEYPWEDGTLNFYSIHFRQFEKGPLLNFIVLPRHRYNAFVEATILFREFMVNNTMETRITSKDFRIGFFECYKFFYRKSLGLDD